MSAQVDDVEARHAPAALADEGLRRLAGDDPELADLLARDLAAQHDTLAMVASVSVADPSVLVCAGAALANVTAEGYPGHRFHPGAEWFDRVESLAVLRARECFGAREVNVQPHSCSSANLALLAALLDPGDTLLSLSLGEGGHLTHGSRASMSGRFWRPVHYGVSTDGWIDYGQAAELARRHRPRIVIAGASSYPRQIDFARFRKIADEVGALLLADISHVAGLVAAGLHPNPVDVAHLTTTSTYKQLAGPRGGLILLGRERLTPIGQGTLSDLVARAVFPRSQGTPSPGAIAAKARALHLAARPAFHRLAGRIVDTARALADALSARGVQLVTGGTDTHLVLADLRPLGISGLAAERALEACGILANRNLVPGDTRSPMTASGLRLGTNVLAQRGLPPELMALCADLVCTVLVAIPPGESRRLDPRLGRRVRAQVSDLCAAYPLPGYPVPARAGRGEQ